MKNSEEIANRLLERRKIYLSEQKRKRKIITTVTVSVCCICIVAAAGIGLSKGTVFTNPVTTEQAAEDAIYPGIKDTFDDKNGESADSPALNNKIIINTIDKIDSSKMYFALMWDDFIEMTAEEMIEYYGIDYFPEVPEDIKLNTKRVSGIYRRDKGTGEVYHDEDRIEYANEDFSRGMALSINKGGYVFHQFLYFKGTEERSVINNIEVIIGLSPDGCYYSEFMYKGCGFFIFADGLTENELIDVIASVIK